MSLLMVLLYLMSFLDFQISCVRVGKGKWRNTLKMTNSVELDGKDHMTIMSLIINEHFYLLALKW